jgi:hypothetical protein
MVGRMVVRAPRRVRVAVVCASAATILFAAAGCSDSGDNAGTASSQAAVGAADTSKSQAAEGSWSGNADVIVFLCEPADPREDGCAGGPATPEQRDATEARLSALPQVELIRFETSEDAFAKFRTQHGDRDAEGVTAAEFPESFHVKLMNPADADIVDAELSGLPGVHDVYRNNSAATGS